MEIYLLVRATFLTILRHRVSYLYIFHMALGCIILEVISAYVVARPQAFFEHLKIWFWVKQIRQFCFVVKIPTVFYDCDENNVTINILLFSI